MLVLHVIVVICNAMNLGGALMGIGNNTSQWALAGNWLSLIAQIMKFFSGSEYIASAFKDVEIPGAPTMSNRGKKI